MSTGIYNATPPTLVDGQTVAPQMDANGNLKTVSGSTGASANQVQGNAANGATDSGNPVKVGGKYNVTRPTLTDGQRGDLQLDQRAAAYVTISAPDGGPLATSVGLFVIPKPNTTGGVSMARLVASAGANIKNAAGQLYGGTVTNSNAAIRYLHLYNKASAATLSTDTPVATFALPPNASVQITSDGLGAAFATGISWAFTTDDIAIPATVGATTDIHGTLFYK